MMTSSSYDTLMVKNPPGVDELPLRKCASPRVVTDLIKESDPTYLWLRKAHTHHMVNGVTQSYLAVYKGVEIGPEALWVRWDCYSKELRLVEFEDKNTHWKPVDCLVFHYDQEGWKPEMDTDPSGREGQGVSYGHCKFILDEMQKFITFPKAPTRILVAGEAVWEV